jgi:hypothetical protein
MAGRGNPSFLKNQKAQKRVAKANAKRAARMARNAEKAAGRNPGDALDEENVAAPESGDAVAETETTPDEGAPPA